LDADRKKLLREPTIEYCNIYAPYISYRISLTGKTTDDPLFDGDSGCHIDLLFNAMDDTEKLSKAFDSGGIGLETSGIADELPTLRSAEISIRLLRKFYEKNQRRKMDWRFLATALIPIAQSAWRDGSCYPHSLHEDAPLCLFVWNVLNFMGIRLSPSSVSAGLRKLRAQGRIATAEEIEGKN
jgi:hypothetical protein